MNIDNYIQSIQVINPYGIANEWVQNKKLKCWIYGEFVENWLISVVIYDDSVKTWNSCFKCHIFDPDGQGKWAEEAPKELQERLLRLIDELIKKGVVAVV